MRTTSQAYCSLILFGCGIWLGTSGTIDTYARPYILWVWICTLLITPFFSSSWKKVALWISLPLGFWAGWSHSYLWRRTHSDTFNEGLSFQGEVIVSDAPDIRSDKILLTVHPLNSPIQHNILLKTDLYPRFQYGDHLFIKAILNHPESIEGFDYPLFLQKSQVNAVSNRPAITFLSEEPSITRSLFLLRSTIENHINNLTPEPESSFLSGILLGSKRAIPESIQEELKATGTTHIVAISGANITILLTLLLKVLPFYRPRSKLITIGGIALFISILTGASSSVLRGAAVAILGSTLRWQERLPRSLGMTLLPATGMLIMNPLLLKADPGFQLSFAAYAGLLFLGNYATRFTNVFPILKSLPEVVRAAFAETTAASIGTAPVSLLVFGQANMLGLLVNPAILWLLPAITLFGLLLISIGWYHPIGMLILFPLWFLLHTVLTTIHIFSLL